MTEIAGAGEQEVRNSQLEQNRNDAVNALASYLQTPEEVILREHQVDVMQSLHDSFQNGNTGGYIHLPTGSGKTVIASEIARVIDKKTLIISPTKLILQQTYDATQRHSPESDITNYYDGEKDLSGKIINTTYVSLQRLIAEGKLNPDEIGLVIADEVHTALGPTAHKVFREFPNALLIGLTATPFFEQLDTYQRYGKVEKNERWTQMYRNLVHEMSKEEAIERGVLSPVDIYLLKTLSSVGDVHITGGGNYREDEIKRYLDKEIRNYMTIAMLAGLDHIPAKIEFDNETYEKLTKLNELLKDRRTVVFGMDIEHIEDMAQRLRWQGVSAEAIHGKMTDMQRNEVLARHKSGETRVILGVDVLRLGWDSPETEAAVLMDPTQSPIVLEQELGRILRPNPEGGKQRALAIQMVDTYKNKSQEPLLLTDLFDPYYVMKMRRDFPLETQKHQATDAAPPKVTFSGIDFKLALEEYKYYEIVRERFRNSSIDEIQTFIDQKLDEIISSNPEIEAYDMYKRLADKLPSRVSNEFAERIFQAVASNDTNISAKGRNIAPLVFMGTVLSSISDFIEAEPALKDDIIQSAMTGVIDDLSRLNPRAGISQQIYYAARHGAAGFISSTTGLNTAWLKSRDFYRSFNEVQEEFAQGGVTKEMVEEAVDELSDKSGISKNSLNEYLNYIVGEQEFFEALEDIVPDIASSEEIDNRAFTRAIARALSAIPSRERRVIVASVFEGRTLTDIALNEEVGSGRIRKLKDNGLRRMRMPSHSRDLLPFLGEYKNSEIDFIDWLKRQVKLPINIHERNVLQDKFNKGEISDSAMTLDNLRLLRHTSPEGIWARTKHAIQKGTPFGRYLMEHPLPNQPTLRDEINAYKNFNDERMKNKISKKDNVQ